METAFDITFWPNSIETEQQSPLNKDTAKVFLSKWRSEKHFELIEIDVEESESFRKGSYKFRLARKYTNIGNAGEAILYEGYLLVHPFDPNYLVILDVYHDYELQSDPPDTELHDIGLDWLAGVSFSNPSPQERKVMREMKTWIMP